MAVNFTKNQDEITKAWRDVVDHKDTQNWALFGYEGTTNNINLTATGTNGLNELVSELNCSLIQYAFCRVISNENAINKLVLINWQGESAPLSRKGLCASHVGDVANYFKGCTQTITIRNDDEATEEYLMEQIMRTSSSSKIGFVRSPILTETSSPKSTSANSTIAEDDGPSSVGSTYKKTDIRSEISIDRKSFWQRQEEEEKERILEEKKRAAERQAQFERERKLREESEAKKLAETIKERERIIEATRQAEKPHQSASSSAANSGQDTDDGRVGRRSELIRLERNQETQSLISKGLIKNKRAIFEQASQQPYNGQSQQQPNNNLTRRPSGTIVTQRLNTFQSVDASSNITAGDTDNNGTHVEKLTNGFAKQVSVSDNPTEDAKTSTTTVVKKQVETVEITNEDKVAPISLVVTPEATPISTTSSPPISESREVAKPVSPAKKIQDGPKSPSNSHEIHQNGNKTPVVNDDVTVSADVNGNNEDTKNGKSPQHVDTILRSGEGGIKAIALYDYQASDSTEISFDPDDIIGFIDKIDVGWWQGSVLTGQYKGQTGLFPHNYVKEIDSI